MPEERPLKTEPEFFATHRFVRTREGLASVVLYQDKFYVDLRTVDDEITSLQVNQVTSINPTELTKEERHGLYINYFLDGL